MSSSIAPDVTAPALDDKVLGDLLTSNRLRSYLRACDGDLSAALRLYEWNSDVSGAVLVTTGMVEVIVRNAMDRALVAWAGRQGGGSWFDLAPLDYQGREKVEGARERATSRGRRTEEHGKVIAELNLGFWRYLASRRYLTTLWTPSLAGAFQHGPTDVLQRLREVDRRLASMLLVRNRAAHHEPIHRRDLAKDYREAVELASWVHPDGGAWLASRSAIPALVAARTD